METNERKPDCVFSSPIDGFSMGEVEPNAAMVFAMQ